MSTNEKQYIYEVHYNKTGIECTLYVQNIYVLYTTLCDKVCQLLTTDLWFSPVSTSIAEIWLKVALNIITLTYNLNCQAISKLINRKTVLNF